MYKLVDLQLCFASQWAFNIVLMISLVVCKQAAVDNRRWIHTDTHTEPAFLTHTQGQNVFLGICREILVLESENKLKCEV